MEQVVLITQARMGSSRLPGKVLKKIKGRTLLQIHTERLKKCQRIDKIIVASTNNIEDLEIHNLTLKLGVSSFRGSELDVLDRFYQAVKNEKPNWVVRVTSDCPLLDPDLVDKVIEFAVINNVDYCSNQLIENFPDGQDVEVFKFSALQMAWKNATLSSEREHVTPFIINNCDYKGKNTFKALNYNCKDNYSNIRMTVDELKDFELIKILVENLGIRKSWMEYVKFIISENLVNINSGIIRNEGYLKSLKEDNNG